VYEVLQLKEGHSEWYVNLLSRDLHEDVCPRLQHEKLTQYLFLQSTDTKNAGSGTSNNASNSLSGFLSTLIPVGLQAAAFVGVFFLIRSKYKRVYRPRTYLDTLHDG
jgi:hypothetical protein